MSSGIEFDEDKYGISQPRPADGQSAPQNSSTPAFMQNYAANSDPKMVRWLMKHGWAKTSKSANALLLIIVVINIVITVIVIKLFI